MEEFIQFEWLGDKESESYSDPYNKLLRDEKSTMTKDDCREFAKMVGAYDIEEEITKILQCRREMKDILISDGLTEQILGEPLDDFIRNAFPFEQLFRMRY